MPGSAKTAMLLDELATLDPAQRREVAEELRKLSETLAQVSDGKTTSHVLGVLAHLLDPGCWEWSINPGFTESVEARSGS